MRQLVRAVRLSRLSAGLANSRLKRKTRTNCHTYTRTLLPPDDGVLASPKHVDV
jgi:hypothetical protein